MRHVWLGPVVGRERRWGPAADQLSSALPVNVREICAGTFTLPVGVAAAVPLFTREGERRWGGASWDPIYALPQAANDDSAPGAVFTTEGAGAGPRGSCSSGATMACATH